MGAWGRAVASNGWALVVGLAVLCLARAVFLGDGVFALTTAVVGAVSVWFVPRLLARSTRRRVSHHSASQAQTTPGPRTLWITDAGLSDTGPGSARPVPGTGSPITWSPAAAVFGVGLSVVVDIPRRRRGVVAAIDAFAAHTVARKTPASTSVQPA